MSKVYFQEKVFDMIASLSGQKNSLKYSREFVKLTGSLAAGILIGQLIYWTDRQKDKDGWIYKTYNDWEEELGITSSVVRTAKCKLERLGFIETKVKKENGTPIVHYRVNKEAFTSGLMEQVEKKHSDLEMPSSQMESEDLASGNAKSSVSSIAEITAKTTSTEVVVSLWNETAIQLDGMEGYKFQRFSKAGVEGLCQLKEEALSAFSKAIPFLSEYADHYSWYFDGRELPSSISPSLFLKCPERMKELVSMPANNF